MICSEGESKLNARLVEISKDAPGIEQLRDKATESTMLHMDTNAALYKYLPFVLHNWNGDGSDQDPVYYVAVLMSVWINRMKHLHEQTSAEMETTMEMGFK